MVKQAVGRWDVGTVGRWDGTRGMRIQVGKVVDGWFVSALPVLKILHEWQQRYRRLGYHHTIVDDHTNTTASLGGVAAAGRTIDQAAGRTDTKVVPPTRQPLHGVWGLCRSRIVSICA
jgi:hypothetical protein